VKERKIGPAVVRLLQGDITACEVDGLINVTGKSLGVSQDSPESNKACFDLETTLFHGQNRDKAVVMTAGTLLRAKHVLNTLSIETTSTAGAKKIRKIMRAILEEAQEQELESLAIPAIGTGIGKFPLEKSAEILIDELARSLSQADNHLRKIIFVLENQKSYKVFEHILEQFDNSEYF
jgi:O-acetyl-ADP-ribose deacetylase